MCHMKASGTTWTSLAVDYYFSAVYIGGLSHMFCIPFLCVLFPYVLCVCLLIIQVHSKWKLLFYCNFSMPQIAWMSVGVQPPSPQFWQVNVTSKCKLQNEDHVGWCVNLKSVLMQSTLWHHSLSRIPRFVKSQTNSFIL